MSQHHERIKNDPRWKAARLACLERDGYVCVDCGATEDLQADHVLELNEYPDLAFELENLLTRCGPCNRDKHLNIKDKGARRSEWVSPRYSEVLSAIERVQSLRGAP